MRRAFVLLAAVSFFALAAGPSAIAEDVAVIVHKSNPIGVLTMAQLRKIVLGQEMKWATGQKIAVLMTSPGQPERAGTLKILCGMNETDFTLHFLHASFNGHTSDPPKALASSLLVRQLVAGTENAIGFIRASQLDGSVKSVTIDGYAPGQPAYKLRLK